ncbi:HSF5 protein, partial [Glaucidium brasilianum]|nr:HSF5 protein [Glaucidium brasilianum]
PADINPNYFPARLWRLVNSPRFPSLRRDARGRGLLIQQRQFERAVLAVGPGSHGAPGANGLFKAKRCASIIRQLNRYGFCELAAGASSDRDGGCSGPLHHFYGPHFVRDRPDLLVRVKRLTEANRAKLAAGLEGKSRPAPRSQQ